MKRTSYCFTLLMCATSSLSAQTIITDETAEYWPRVGLEEALEWEEKDSIFAISIYGENYDLSYIADSTQVGMDLLKFRNLQILEITDMLANEVLERLDELPMLRYLTLRNTGIDNLPQSFYSLKNLRVLKLQDLEDLRWDSAKLVGNQIVELELVRVSSVKYKDPKSDDWELVGYDHPIQFFPHLKKFKLEGSEYNIPPGVFQLNEIVELNFERCNFTEIPEAIGKLSTLEVLDISINEEISVFPDSFGNLKALRILDMSSCAFEELPVCLRNCTNLEALDASYNSIMSLPAWVGEFRMLRILNLDRGYIPEIPAEIESCQSLEYLYLSSNVLTEFPVVVFNLPNLQTLDLSANGITHFPEGMAKLANLRDLYLQTNPIRSFSPDAFISSSLTTLDLSNCGFNALPENMSRLTTLNSFQCTGDSLTRIPSSLLQISTLTNIDLSDNQLTELPQTGWGNLNALFYLSLSYNQLTTIPTEIYKCPVLYGLNINNNQIKKLPKGISKMESLSMLRTQGNKGIVFSKEVGAIPQLETLQVGSEDLTPKNLAKLKKWVGPEKLEISDY